MKQHSKSNQTIIFFKSWEVMCLRNFVLQLFSKRNYYTSTKFKKTDQLPKDIIYLQSYLKYNYPFDKTKNIINNYQTIVDNLSLTLDKAINVFDYLQDNNISQTSIANILDYAFEPSKSQRPKQNPKIKLYNFLQGDHKHG